jgi:hypothetical protein
MKTDGLNSSIEPNSRGASGGNGLPPRTHAIHTILFRAYPGGLTLDEVTTQLRSWKYKSATLRVTRNHLDHLRRGWGTEIVIAVVKNFETNRYSLTPEGYTRLASGLFSDALPVERHPLPPEPVPKEDESFAEGKESLRLHRKLERNQKLVRRKKEQVLEANVKLACEVCEFDFAETYGELGDGYAECHHTAPMAKTKGIRHTKLSDLAVVCSNCHKMLHRRPFHTIPELRAVVQGQN